MCRAVAYQYAISTEPESFRAVEVSLGLVEEALGVNNRMDMMMNERITRPGVAIGLAYTTVGGRALLIETMKYPGNGALKLTGQLGEVMQESISTSLSWIKGNATALGLLQPQSETALVVESHDSEQKRIHHMLNSFDLHVHFPAAATPKDGPSAGVTITVALVSLMTGRRVRSDFAMTGELSL